MAIAAPIMPALADLSIYLSILLISYHRFGCYSGHCTPITLIGVNRFPMNLSRILADPVAANSPLQHSGFAVAVDKREGRAPVWGRKRPGHFPNPGSAGHSPDSKPMWPFPRPLSSRGVLYINERVTGIMKVRYR